MHLLARPAAVLVVLAATLAGCGGGSDASDPSPSADPTTAASSAPTPVTPDGDKITTDDFSYVVPSGWMASEQTKALTLAIDMEDKDGFSDNINVVSDDTVVGLDPIELESAIEKVLKGADGADVTIAKRAEIDGEEAIHARATFTLPAGKYRTEQYAVAHDDAGYIVTFSFSESVSEAQRDELSESILASWKWAS